MIFLRVATWRGPHERYGSHAPGFQSATERTMVHISCPSSRVKLFTPPGVGEHRPAEIAACAHGNGRRAIQQAVMPPVVASIASIDEQALGVARVHSARCRHRTQRTVGQQLVRILEAVDMNEEVRQIAGRIAIAIESPGILLAFMKSVASAAMRLRSSGVGDAAGSAAGAGHDPCAIVAADSSEPCSSRRRETNMAAFPWSARWHDIAPRAILH